ncbi:sugar phosphate isomerase/epimerase family protein [Candidatus Contubernalis alkaliaceticus]|uniref:sugar phosphate isomerase/epimerase family protein n=1 Tax=Candidatus Contubernalis alkaliaceticus TaxID=338645 RepID=UPI001F4C4408|nr:sugar phosphate isomerase/epimerase family protein [Candidatus Contubernalis alkalaceticus]UNC92261.1 sugar phosphate isomerase/epimerase [Candidatus Contubernalis alkalaceticus]
MKIGTGLYLQLLEEDPEFYSNQFQHIEIQEFVLPDNIDVYAKDIIKNYQKILRDFKGTISLHGPFKELALSSMDSMVRELADKRFSAALEFGIELGCTTLVVHSCYNTLMNYPGYKENWLENCSLFWDKFLPKCENAGITAVLENIWDKKPGHMVELLKSFDCKYFKACLDTGHANIFSHLTIEQWVQELGEFLVHAHVHDNHGIEDEHLLVGKGSINFKGLLPPQNGTSITMVNEAFGTLEEEASYVKYLTSCLPGNTT